MQELNRQGHLVTTGTAGRFHQIRGKEKMISRYSSQASRLSLLLVFAFCISIASILSACTSAQTPQTFVIGVANPVPIMDPVLEGFKAGMADLGYTEGENVTYLYEGPVGRDGLNGVIQGFVDQDVDLILAITTPAAQEALTLAADKNIPVIFVPVTDPIEANLVSDLRHPEGNITGITTGGSDPKRLEWLVKIAPDVKRVYLPYNPEDKSPVAALEQLRTAAGTLGIELVLQETSDADAVAQAIENIPDDVDAIFIGPDSLVGSLSADWINAAIERKLPLTGSSVSHVEAGMLFSYSYDTVAAGKQAARLADKVLKGNKTTDLPVETSEFFLSINQKTAEAIGLEIPDEILQQAGTIFH